MKRAVAMAYALLLASLVAYGVQFWNIRCESFGCTGVGIAWFAWAIGFVVVGVVGLIARHLAPQPSRMRQGLQALLLAQAAGAIGLGISWMINR
jgi:hypothetical protein